MEKMHNVYFYGNLATLYGDAPIAISGTSLQDIFRGLKANFGRGFHNLIKSGSYQVTKGARKVKAQVPLERDKFISNNEVGLPVEDTEIHVFPALAGAGRFGQIIVGVVLIIVAIVMFWNPLGWSAAVGAGAAFSSSTIATVAVAGILSVVGGVISLLSSPTGLDDYSKAEPGQNPSFLYNGVVNVIEQGGPVPIAIGRHITGSTVISANLTLDQRPFDPYGHVIGSENAVAIPETSFALVEGWTGVNADVTKVNTYLYLNKSGAGTSYVELDVTSLVTPGEFYTLQTFVQTDGQGTVTQVVEDGAGTYMSKVSDSTDWGFIVSNATFPSSFTGNMYLRYYFTGPVGTKVTLKNIKLYQSIIVPGMF